MKLITVNLLNRFWANGVKPIITNFNSHTVKGATASSLGHVKLTASSAVTDSTGLALAATEKNASIEGTLANQIGALNSNLDKRVSYNNPMPIIVAFANQDQAGGIPTEGYYVVLNLIESNSEGNYKQGIQIAFGYFGTAKRYTRSWANSVNTSEWVEF